MDTGCVAEEKLNDSGIPESTGETLCDSVVSVAGSRREKRRQRQTATTARRTQRKLLTVDRHRQ